MSFPAIFVSSSRIRSYLEHGELRQVEKMLGRRYSILSRVEQGSQNGQAIGFPTANVNIDGLCLLHAGVYAVNLLHEHECPFVQPNSISCISIHYHLDAQTHS